MNSITIFDHTIKSINYIARSNTLGDEFDMVVKYINDFISKHTKLKEKKFAIFIEPCIPTGYPDIVIVEYYNLQNMKNNSAILNKTCLKILFEINNSNFTSVSSLSSKLGFSEKDVLKAVNILDLNHLIHFSSNKKSIRKTKLSTYSGIKRIISIEAKIDKWREALSQASKNTCFSTDSYILINKKVCNQEIIAECRKHGIGIILVNGKIETVLKCEHRPYPVSYISFEFNEWIKKYIQNPEVQNDNNRINESIFIRH